MKKVVGLSTIKSVYITGYISSVLYMIKKHNL